MLCPVATQLHVNPDHQNIPLWASVLVSLGAGGAFGCTALAVPLLALLLFSALAGAPATPQHPRIDRTESPRTAADASRPRACRHARLRACAGTVVAFCVLSALGIGSGRTAVVGLSTAGAFVVALVPPRAEPAPRTRSRPRRARASGPMVSAHPPPPRAQLLHTRSLKHLQRHRSRQPTFAAEVAEAAVAAVLGAYAQRESNPQSPAPARRVCRPGDDELASRCRYGLLI